MDSRAVVVTKKELMLILLEKYREIHKKWLHEKQMYNFDGEEEYKIEVKNLKLQMKELEVEMLSLL